MLATNWTYVIINTVDLSQVNFDEVLQTSEDTVRKSIDGTKCVLKYNGNLPPSLEFITLVEGPYTQEQILQVLLGEDWVVNDPY